MDLNTVFYIQLKSVIYSLMILLLTCFVFKSISIVLVFLKTKKEQYCSLKSTLMMEPARGIGPPSHAWQARVIATIRRRRMLYIITKFYQDVKCFNIKKTINVIIFTEVKKTMKNKRRKVRKILYPLLIGFILGFSFSALVYTNTFRRIGRAMSLYPWYVHVLFVPLGFFVAILIHELAHFISLKKQGISSKAIYVFIFVLIKQKRWTIKLFPRFGLMLGGLVMPIINDITDEQKLIDIKQKLAKSIIAGPRWSFIFGIITTIVLIASPMTNLDYLTGFIIVFGITVIIMTLLVYVASKAAMDGLYGDFVAYEQIQKNLEFLVMYILSGSDVSQTAEENEKFLWPKIIQLLSTKSLTANLPMKTFFLHYLEQVIFNNQIGCTSVDNKIKRVNLLDNDEQSLILNYYLAFWYYKNDHSDRAFEILNQIDDKKYKVKSKVAIYWQHLCDHVLGLKDNQEFLSNSKNYAPSSMQWIFKPLKLTIEVPSKITPITINDNQMAESTEKMV